MTIRQALFGAASLTLVACGTPQETIHDQVPDTPEPSAVPTASASTKPASTVKTLFVNDKLVDCEGGAGPRKCLQIRESEAGDWELFYASIAGFTFEEGHSYELRVDVKPVERPAADASSLAYTLVEVVAKKPAQ